MSSDLLTRPAIEVDDDEPSNHSGDELAARRPRDASRRAQTRDLLSQVRTASPTERRALRDRVVELNMGVAREVARRYRLRGVSSEDLEQVAYLALVKAVDRFDPKLADDFLSFAVPTIRGEVRRYFRDQGWMIRPPRSVQETTSRIHALEAELCQEFGRAPRPSELADRLGADLELVMDCLAANGCFHPASLDSPGVDSHVAPHSADELGLAAAEARVLLRPLVDQLSDREKQLVSMRFTLGWTQAEIGAQLGITQTQVSRLLAGIFARLREQIGTDPAA